MDTQVKITKRAFTTPLLRASRIMRTVATPLPRFFYGVIQNLVITILRDGETRAGIGSVVCKFGVEEGVYRVRHLPILCRSVKVDEFIRLLVIQRVDLLFLTILAYQDPKRPVLVKDVVP